MREIFKDCLSVRVRYTYNDDENLCGRVVNLHVIIRDLTSDANDAMNKFDAQESVFL